MEITCPFLFMSNYKCQECVYINDDKLCDEIEVNPGNGDAWCYRMIELGMGATYPEEE